MKVKLKGGGEAEIPENHVVHIPEGLFGFDGREKFVLVPQSESADSPFLWLQSLDEADLAFLCLDPRFFRPNYLPKITKEEWESVGAKPEDAVLLSLVVVPPNPNEMTANLLGPLVLNPLTRTGRQVISQDPTHGVRHRILEELAALRGAESL